MNIFTWTSLNSGLWSDSDNWLNGIVPQNNPEDDVLIDVAGEITTTHRQRNTVIKNFTSKEKFNLREGNLTVQNATLNNTVILGSSNYVSNKPEFIVNDVANLNGNSTLWDGTLEGVFNNYGVLTFADSVVNLRNATLNNHNQIIQENLSLVYLRSSEINNLAGSTYNIQGGSLLARVPNQNSTFSLSDSTLEKTTANTGVIDVRVKSNNSHILVKNGTLKFTEGGEIVESAIIISNDAILHLKEESGERDDFTYKFNQSTINGDGLLEIDGQIEAEGTVTFGDRTKLLTFATLLGDTFINPAAGTFSIEGLATDSTRKLEATLTNLGIIEHHAPGLALNNGEINNQGTYKLFGSNYGLPQWLERGLYQDVIIYDVTIGDGSFPSTLKGHLSERIDGGTFFNTGTIVAEVGYGDYSEIAVTLVDTNGIIQANNSTLALSGENSIYQGTKFITNNYLDDDGNSQPSTIRFNGGTHLFRDNVSFTDNNGNIQIGGSGTKFIAENTLYLEKETIWGDLLGFSFLQGVDENSKIINRGVFSLSTGMFVPPELTWGLPFLADENHTRALDVNFINEVGATIEHSRGYIELELKENGTIENYGKYDFLVEDGADIVIHFNNQVINYDDTNRGDAWIRGEGEINNWSSGVFEKTGSKSGEIWTTFNNYGLVKILDGKLSLSGGGDNNGGSYLISENTQFTFADDTYNFLNTTINNQGQLNFNGGTYNIEDQLILTGATKWLDTDYYRSHFLGNGTVTNQGNFTLSEQGVRYEIDVKEFINKSNLVIKGGRVYLGGQFTNVAGANLTLGGSHPAINELNNQAGIKLTNHGTLRVNDDISAYLAVFLENDSLVDIRSGSFTLAGGSLNKNALYRIASGTTLVLKGEEGFINGNSNQFQGTTFENAGSILIDRGHDSSAVALEALDEVILNGQVEWKGGAIAGVGSVTNTDILTIDGLTYLETTLNNTHRIVKQGFPLWFRGGVLNNQTGAEFEMQGGEIKVWSILRDSSSFNNAGTFLKTNNNDLTVSVNFNNTGTLAVTAGTLTLTEGGTQSGLITIADNATLVLDDGTEDLPFTFTDSSSIDNQGTLRIAAKIVADTNPLVLNGDTRLNYSGELEGVGYLNQGKFTVGGGRIKSNFQNAGEVRLSGYSTELTLINATLENLEQGKFEFAQGTITTTSFSQNASLINQGIFNKFSTGDGNVEVEFINDGGEVNIQEGSILFREAFTQTSGSFHLNNSSISSWDVLNFAAGRVRGEGTIISSYNPVQFDAANIDIADRDVGTIKIRGDYSESDNTTHYIDIKSSSEFDRLVIEKINSYTNDSGNAQIGGSYEIRVDEAFKNQLAEGNRFEIVTSENLTLDDNGIELINADIGNGLRFAAEFDNNSLDLVVVSGNANNSVSRLANNSTITGTINNDILTGTQNDDLINGLAGDDLLRGNGGNDTLIGDAGADVFVLEVDRGTDTIQDFADGIDSLSLSDGLTFADLTIGGSGNDTEILDNTNSLIAVLEGINPSFITQADFIEV